VPRYHINLTPAPRPAGMTLVHSVTIDADVADHALRAAAAMFPGQVLDAVDAASGESFVMVTGSDA
jgi:hypothetical protein